MPVIIDGYNLLRSIQRDEQFESLTEVGLCRIISDYMKNVRNHGHVVFDGTGPRDKSDFDQLGGLGNIEVYFSGEHLEADDLIIEKIDDSSAPKKLIIVSSDREIRAAAASRKAVSVKSDYFWQDVQNRLETYQKPAYEPKAKRGGITEAEADQWLDFFGIDKD
jgi:predicted RNA-binding protein with PIN domain